MNKKDLNFEFRTEILWFQRFCNHSLDKMIDCRRNQLIREIKQEKGRATYRDLLSVAMADDELKRLYSWKNILTSYIADTDENLLQVLKAVFVTNSMTITGAGQRYLYYSKSSTYQIIYKWLHGLAMLYYKEK